MTTTKLTGTKLGTRFGAAATVGLIAVGLLQMVAPSLGVGIAVDVLIVAACSAAIVTVLYETGDPEHPRI